MKKLIISIFVSITMLSCVSDYETIPPSIEILKPKTNDTIVLGKYIDLNFYIEDDYGIDYYSYEVISETPTAVNAFNFFKDRKFSDRVIDYNFKDGISVPLKYNDTISTLDGNYTIRVIAVDKFGNRNSVEKTIKFVSVKTN